MTSKAKLNLLVSAALAGGGTALLTAIGDPAQFSPSHSKAYLSAFAGGAIFGLINHLRQSPLDK